MMCLVSEKRVALESGLCIPVLNHQSMVVLRAIKAHFILLRVHGLALGSLYKPDNVQVLQKLPSLPFNDFHLLFLPLILHRNAGLDSGTYVTINRESICLGKQTHN